MWISRIAGGYVLYAVDAMTMPLVSPIPLDLLRPIVSGYTT